MKQTLIDEMKAVFVNDRRRVNHALSVLEYAERIASVEGGDMDIITAAAILHDIGIKEAEKKHYSSLGKYQEIEGPPIATKILEKHEFSSEQIEHVCEIIANHHSDKGIRSCEFRVIWDADWLVNIPVELSDLRGEKLNKLINKVFKTSTGSEIARKELLAYNQ